VSARFARAPVAAAIVATSLVIGLTVAGCGGHTATKRDVIARANAICAGTLRDVRAVPPPTTGTSGLSAYLRKVAPIVEKEGAATRALPRPAQDRAVLNRYIAAVTAADADYKALAAAAASHDAGAISQALASLHDNPATTLAVQYGLGQCAAAAGTGVS
jgi:hypothetical protein